MEQPATTFPAGKAPAAEAEVVGDTEPLLKVARHSVDVDLEAGHDWQGGLCQCCGSCDSVGWLSCVLSQYLPCVAVGLNGKRAFSGSAIRHALLFVVMMVLVYALRILNVVAFSNNCYDGFHHGPTMVIVSHENGVDPFAAFHPHAAPTPLCGKLQPIRVGISLLLSAYAVFLLICMAQRRTQIREKFNIKGSVLGDLWAWCCCMPCALCQETRTLWHNNVHDGVWYGPTTPAHLTGAVVTTAPVVSVMGKET